MGRRLGQHFLINKKKIKRIVDALKLKDGDTVIEIGPGRGELTKELVISNQKLAIRIIAVEKDEKLASALAEKLRDDDRIEIMIGDALKVLPRVTSYELRVTDYKLIGNIPFYITGRLLRVVGELEHKPLLSVLTIQKEVAKRLCASPPKMNLLAASVQFWAIPKTLGVIPKKDFKPRPNVDGATVRLITRNERHGKRELRSYYTLIKALFKHPRKTVLNNLIASKGGIGATRGSLVKTLLKAGISPQNRPQDVEISTIKKLSLMLYNSKDG